MLHVQPATDHTIHYSAHTMHAADAIESITAEENVKRETLLEEGEEWTQKKDCK